MIRQPLKYEPAKPKPYELVWQQMEVKAMRESLDFDVLGAAITQMKLLTHKPHYFFVQYLSAISRIGGSQFVPQINAYALVARLQERPSSNKTRRISHRWFRIISYL